MQEARLRDWLSTRMHQLLPVESVSAVLATLIKNDVKSVDLLLCCSDADLVEMLPTIGLRTALKNAMAAHVKEVAVRERLAFSGSRHRAHSASKTSSSSES